MSLTENIITVQSSHSPFPPFFPAYDPTQPITLPTIARVQMQAAPTKLVLTLLEASCRMRRVFVNPSDKDVSLDFFTSLYAEVLIGQQVPWASMPLGQIVESPSPVFLKPGASYTFDERVDWCGKTMHTKPGDPPGTYYDSDGNLVPREQRIYLDYRSMSLGSVTPSPTAPPVKSFEVRASDDQWYKDRNAEVLAVVTGNGPRRIFADVQSSPPTFHMRTIGPNAQNVTGGLVEWWDGWFARCKVEVF